ERGAFCNAGIANSRSENPGLTNSAILVQITDVFSQEFLLSVFESVVSELDYCAKSQLLLIEPQRERALARQLWDLVSPDDADPSDFDELLERYANLHSRLSEFVRRRFIYEE